MFERFTDRARTAVTGAEAHARRLGHSYTGTEHLLLSLSEGDGVAARALDQVGFDRGRFELAVLAEVGKGPAMGLTHMPFTPRVKQALVASLRQSLSANHNYIGTEHVLLGLLEDDSSLATKLVTEQGISTGTVKAAVMELLVGLQSAGEQLTTAAPVEADWAETAERLSTEPPETPGARCPGCRGALAPNLGADVIPSVGEVERAFTVAYCRACGHVLAVLPED